MRCDWQNTLVVMTWDLSAMELSSLSQAKNCESVGQRENQITSKNLLGPKNLLSCPLESGDSLPCYLFVCIYWPELLPVAKITTDDDI